MKTKRFKILSIAAVLILTVSLCACAKVDKDSPTAPLPPGYGESGFGNAYKDINEMPFTDPAQTPDCAFGLNVNTASYALLRRLINEGAPIDKNGVRIEEMINYFGFGYERPQEGLALGGAVMDCPWNTESKLLQVVLQAEEIQQQDAPVNLVLLIDVSGSMYGADRLGLIQASMGLLLEQLSDDDTVSLVTYANGVKTFFDGKKGRDRIEIRAAIDGLQSGGGTAGQKGLETAFDCATRNRKENGINKVLLCTDGDFNVGMKNDDELEAYVKSKRESGVGLTILGFGNDNLSDKNLLAMTEAGGQYHYVDTLTQAKKLLVDNLGGLLRIVAKDAKAMVSFHSEQVASYRLIGYEHTLMSAEEWQDPNKASGEIGSGHTVTAMFEIRLKEGFDTAKALATAAVRYKTPDGEDQRELEKVYDIGQYAHRPGEDAVFAAAVTEFGLLLRGSEWKGSASYRSVYDRVVGLDCVRSDPYKVEFVGLVGKFLR